ncbi:MAG: glycosyltransferase family 39 protein [Spirochaetes bacterium]|nr:glycosyltransferase family 39 protein [Spirochaetota bacterium]
MDKKIINKKCYFYILMFFVILALRIPALYHTIIDIDEAAFAEFANKWLGGAIPYAGVYDNKPVLTYFFYYIIFYLFGTNNLFAVHVATIFVVFISASILYSFVVRIAGIDVAKAASLFFIFLMHTYEPKYIATNTETLYTLPVLLSFIAYYCVVLKNKNIFYLLLSGICAGISFLINYKAGVILAAFGVFGVYTIFYAENKMNEFIQQIKILTLVFLGFLMPIFVAIAYFYHKGALSDFINLGFLYNFKYIQSGMTTVPYLKAVARFLLFVICSLPLWIIIVQKLIARLHATSNDKNLLVLLTIWLVGSIFAVMLGWRAYGHYFIQLVLPLSMLAGLFFFHVPSHYKRMTYIYFVVLAIIFTISRINIPLTYHYLGDSNALSDVAYKKVAARVQQITSPHDTMFVWGSGAVAYIYANRRCSSKIIITDYVSGRQFGVSNEDMGENVNKYIQYLREEFMSEFMKKPPEVFIDTSPSGYFGYDRFPLSKFPTLSKMIYTHYTFYTSIDKMNMYLRNDYIKK